MHSMTGFGRGSSTADHFTATVEVSSINRKQAEVVIQGARELATIEPRIRKAVLTRISRGRVQVAITLERNSREAAPVSVDLDLAEALEIAFEHISKRVGRTIAPEAADFLRAPGVVNLDDTGLDPETAWAAIEPALEAALEQALEMRATEGSHLAEDLENRLQHLEAQRSAIGEIAPARPANYREALLKRLRDAGLELELSDERVVREIALFADRCDISEELTRLDSHFRKFRGFLDGGEPAGRPLDFLCQEIHREFNTIGSKASDAAVAQHVVTAKTELEKIREQVQNVE